MGFVLTVPAFLLLTAAVYLVAGRWVSARVRRDDGRADRVLRRASRRCSLILLGLALLACGAVLALREGLGELQSVLLLYLLPLLWLWASVLGASWLAIKAHRLEAGLWRYHRFDLFSAYLMGGQQLPFISAALAASSDLTRGADLLPGLAAHFLAALILGLALRWIVVNRLVELRPLPDAPLFREIERVAGSSRIRLRAVHLVPTERGQSVNAIAATSSRAIYVAEALYRGLDRDEVRAVILHELGHLGQHVTNTFRDLAVLGLPAAFWLALAPPESDMPLLQTSIHEGAVVILTLVGIRLSRFVYHASEHRADLFAERHGSPGALARSLEKLYERNRRTDTEAGDRHPALRERLRALEEAARSSSAAPA